LNQESQPFDIVDDAQNVVIKPKGPSHLHIPVYNNAQIFAVNVYK